MRKISILIKHSGEETVKQLLQTPYYRIYVLIEEGTEIPKSLSNRVIFFSYKREHHRNGIIKKLISDKPRELIIPFFRGDSYSQYAIHTRNQYSNKNIDWKIFKYKHKMNEFVGSEKKAIFLLHDTLSTTSYNDIKKTLWEDTFIVKPINKSASAWAFKIANHHDWEQIQSKLLPCDHVIEEYYPWHLHSVDFYFDGEHVLVLCIVKEMPFIEIMDENKHSEEFLLAYGEEINKHFLYFLPIRYDIPYNKMSDTERKLLSDLWKKLKSIGYKWFIHVEYKFNPITKKVGFIERWARMGWQRSDWIKRLHYFDIKELLYDIHSGDISKWKSYKWSYIFKNIVPNMHYIGIYKNFLKKTSIGEIISSHKNYMEISFQQYIINYFKSLWIVVNNLHIMTSGNKKDFYPSYQWKSIFKVLFEVDDDNFKKLKSKKIQIIEKLVF